MQIRSRDLLRPENLKPKTATLYTNSNLTLMLSDWSKWQQETDCAWPLLNMSLVLIINGIMY